MLTEGLHPSLQGYEEVNDQDMKNFVWKTMADYPLVGALGKVLLGFSPLCTFLVKGLNQFPGGKVSILGEGVEMDKPFKVSVFPGASLVYLPITYHLVTEPPLSTGNCTNGLTGRLKIFPVPFEQTLKWGIGGEHEYEYVARIKAADGVRNNQRLGRADMYFGRPLLPLWLLSAQAHLINRTLGKVFNYANEEVETAELARGIKQGSEVEMGLAYPW